MGVEVRNEVGELVRVVVHGPGDEVARMTQFELEPLLFDDILSVDVARLEHETLCDILARLQGEPGISPLSCELEAFLVGQ